MIVTRELWAAVAAIDAKLSKQLTVGSAVPVHLESEVARAAARHRGLKKKSGTDTQAMPSFYRTKVMRAF